MASFERTIIPQVPKSRALLRQWLKGRLPADSLSWLALQVAIIAAGKRPLQLGFAIGLVPREVGKFDLALSNAEQAAGRSARKDLDASGWSVDQAARVLLVLASHRGDDAAFVDGLDRLLATAEIGEQIAMLQALPLLPCQDLLLPHALDGIRSAAQPIFEAIAHRNPYPRERFSEAQWNQMVLKALFVGSRLASIQGLDVRRNGNLARMLVDYANERRAAGRPISPELWRCVAPFAEEADVEKLSAIVRQGTRAEAAGAALALAECPLPSARKALTTQPDLASAIAGGHLVWDAVA